MPPSAVQLEVWIIKRSYEIAFGENGTFIGKKLLLQKLLRDRLKYGFATFPEEDAKLAFTKLCGQGLAMRLNEEGAARAREMRDSNSEDKNGAASSTTPATTPSTTPAPHNGREVPPVPTAPKSGSPDFLDAISEPVDVRPLEPNPSESMRNQLPNLPYCAQHNITTSLQSILEGACFKFAKRHVPELLTRKRWTCAHSAELSMWTKELSKTFEQKPSSIKLDKIGGVNGLPQLLKSLDELRHSAVHRIPVQADKLILFIHASLQAAEILGDEDKQTAIKAILHGVHTALDKLKVEKKKIEDALSDQLQSIEIQKEKLDRQAKEARKQAEELTILLDDELGAIISQELPVSIISH